MSSTFVDTQPIEQKNVSTDLGIETVDGTDRAIKQLLDSGVQTTEYEQKAFGGDFVINDEVTGEFECYICRYGNLDRHDEILVRGVFAKSIEKAVQTEKRQDIKLLWQHDHHKPVGQIFSFRETPEGIIAKGKLDTSIIGIPLVSLVDFMKKGIIGHFSVGFRALKDKVDEKGIRTILEGDLIEFSVVTIPANTGASLISVKSLNDESQLETKELSIAESNDQEIQEIDVKPVENKTLSFKEAKGLGETTNILKKQYNMPCKEVDALMDFYKSGYNIRFKKFLESENMRKFFSEKDLYIIEKEFREIPQKTLDINNDEDKAKSQDVASDVVHTIATDSPASEISTQDKTVEIQDKKKLTLELFKNAFEKNPDLKAKLLKKNNNK